MPIQVRTVRRPPRPSTWTILPQFPSTQSYSRNFTDICVLAECVVLDIAVQVGAGVEDRLDGPGAALLRFISLLLLGEEGQGQDFTVVVAIIYIYILYIHKFFLPCNFPSMSYNAQP